MNVELHIEALIFASDKPVSTKEILGCLRNLGQDKISKKDIEKHIQNLSEKYSSENFALQVKALANGYIFMTKSDYHDTLTEHLKLSSKKKLSGSALETLSIIAYKQPVTKSEMESIRGVNCDYAVQKLLEKEMVEIQGRREGPGKPLLYGTSTKFMNHFGLKSIDDLPKLREFEEPENTIGTLDKEVKISNGENTSEPSSE